MNKTSSQLHPLRRLRAARRLSQQELGNMLSPPVSKGAVSLWEIGVTYPQREYALQLVDLFPDELSLDRLYRFRPAPVGEAA